MPMRYQLQTADQILTGALNYYSFSLVHKFISSLAEVYVAQYHYMGNYSLNICCEQHGVNTLFTLKESTLAETPLLLTDLQRKFVDSHNPFANEHRKTVTLKINKEDLFEGEVDQKGNPKGYGIFKSHDEQAIYYGKFSELGVDGGKLFYVMPDGSYYEGNLLAGFGITGAYTIPQKGYSYKGDLLHRPDQQIKYIPHGMGIEESTYTFTGKFQHGKRRQGKLQWTQNGSRNIYEGDFDEHQLFTAKGVLKQKTGTYTGQFLKGKKQGHGKYEYLMGLIYEGEYRDGMKNGRGKLLNFDRVLSYEGEFKDGVPHGTGTAYPPNKGPYITEFVQGITKENHRILIGELNVSKARFDL